MGPGEDEAREHLSLSSMESPRRIKPQSPESACHNVMLRGLDFMMEHHPVVPESKHIEILLSLPDNWNNALRCYKSAGSRDTEVSHKLIDTVSSPLHELFCIQILI